MKLNFHQLSQFLYLFSNSEQNFTVSSVVQQLSSAPYLDNDHIWVIANLEGSIPRHSCRNHHSACLPLNQRIIYLLCAMYYANDITMPLIWKSNMKYVNYNHSSRLIECDTLKSNLWHRNWMSGKRSLSPLLIGSTFSVS